MSAERDELAWALSLYDLDDDAHGMLADAARALLADPVLAETIRLAKIGRAVRSIVNLSVNSDEGAGGHVAVWNGEQVGDCFSTAAELLEHLLGAAGTAGAR